MVRNVIHFVSMANVMSEIVRIHWQFLSTCNKHGVLLDCSWFCLNYTICRGCNNTICIFCSHHTNTHWTCNLLAYIITRSQTEGLTSRVSSATLFQTVKNWNARRWLTTNYKRFSRHFVNNIQRFQILVWKISPHNTTPLTKFAFLLVGRKGVMKGNTRP